MIFKISWVIHVENTGPIKLKMKTEEDNSQIMGNLKNLKGEDEFNGIGITEDYTLYAFWNINLLVIRSLKVAENGTGIDWKEHYHEEFSFIIVNISL